jgi:hypothetical protein
MSAGLSDAEIADAEWREHPRFPGYCVSDIGQVRGLKGWILAPETITGGYQRVRLSDGKKHLIHLLVAEVFIGPRPDGHQINHKDGVTSNNAVTNLEYTTPAANVRHSLDVLGRKRARGSRNGASRLNEAQVKEMRAAFAAGGITRTALAAKYGVSRSTVGRIICGTYWQITEGEK